MIKKEEHKKIRRRKMLFPLSIGDAGEAIWIEC